jgi:hypothetical protein
MKILRAGISVAKTQINIAGSRDEFMVTGQIQNVAEIHAAN